MIRKLFAAALAFVALSGTANAQVFMPPPMMPPPGMGMPPMMPPPGMGMPPMMPPPGMGVPPMMPGMGMPSAPPMTYAHGSVDDVVLDVPLITQDTEVWCWAAVSEMVVEYLVGDAPQQCEMLEIGFGLRPGQCCGNEWACRTTGSLDQIAINVRAFGGGQATHRGPMSPDEVSRALDQDEPIIAAIRTHPSMGHVVVIRGIQDGPSGPVLVINDPMMRSSVHVPFAQFAQFWTESLIISG